MDLDSQSFKSLQKIFKKLPEVVAVYFYGSRAKDYAHKSSDLDIAVVVDNIKGIDFGDLYFQVNQIIKDVEVDLRVVTKQTSPTFVFQVIKTGQCIYQRNELGKVQFEAKALSEYYDGQHLRDIYDGYTKSYFERS